MKDLFVLFGYGVATGMFIAAAMIEFWERQERKKRKPLSSTKQPNEPYYD